MSALGTRTPPSSARPHPHPRPRPRPRQLPRRREPSPAAGSVILHPRCGPPGGIDVRPALVRAIAYELWVLTSGAEVVNWLEAEMLLDELLTRSR